MQFAPLKTKRLDDYTRQIVANPRGDTPVLVPTSRRRRTAFGIVALVMALVAGVVVAAVAADGRELSRTSSNDGGAWVVNRELAAVAHKNRATGELSSYVRLDDSPNVDVHQAGDLVVVHDTSTNQLLEVDPRSSSPDKEPTQLPEFTQVIAVDDAVVVFRADPLAVWVIDERALARLSSLADEPPIFESSESGRVAATSDGRVAIAESAAGNLRWINTDGLLSEPIALAIEGNVIDVTIVDASAVVLTDIGELVVVGPSQIELSTTWSALAPGSDQLVRLQQPSAETSSYVMESARTVAAVSATGELVEIALATEGAVVRRSAQLGGALPVAPLAHEGCIYGVVTEPPRFGALCDDLVSQPLVGVGDQIRLRLVNGWVWVNDVESGNTFVTNEDLQLDALDDWSLAIDTVVEEPETPEESTSNNPVADDAVFTDDPDAEGDIRGSDDFTAGAANEPPIAVDDSAETRTDVVVVVDVLANDSDPNNDVITVEETELLTGSASIVITPDRSATQVIPGAGFSGEITYRYSITDGRSEPVSAVVTIQVVPSETNRAPITETDVVATAPGEAATIDVLRNDNDPDGDAIVLTSISSESGGALRWDPSGQVTFTPDSTTEAGWIELLYVVADTAGLEADGRVRVEIRDRGANQEPDARNDQATTVVGRPVVIELLANDSDPDGDPLIVGSLPRLIEPIGVDVRTSTTTDGEFVFSADVPGTYIFSYTVNDSAPDGSESDTARIRVDVIARDDNEPPIAVRDDIVIPVGESRIVYVLDNDGDPDGDVIAIVNWQVSPGLLVSEFNDDTGHVGFEITLTASAGSAPTMTYSISDGVNGPVSAPVAIAVAAQTPQDQPPFAQDDVKEMRAGQTVEVFVLRNDFDPEGAALRIVSVGAAGAATVIIPPEGGSLLVSLPEDAVSSFTVPYDIEDPAGNRAAALLRVQLINRAAANRPPVARTDVSRTEFGQPVVINVLSNDYDPDSDPIALDGIVEQPTRGSVAATADGSIIYTPDPDFRGTDVFTYVIVDGEGDRALGEVFVGVMEQEVQNLAPIANNDGYQLNGPAPTPLDVLNNDRDPEGDPLRVIGVAAAELGTVTLTGLTVIYQPPASMPNGGTDTFTYSIADSAGNQAQATVTIELGAYELEEDVESAADELDLLPEPTPTATEAEQELAPEPTPTVEPTPTPPALGQNAAPVARDDEPAPAKAGVELAIDVLSNDFDPDGEPGELRVISVSGDATTDGNRVFVTPGEESFQLSYTIADAFNAQATAVITVVVTANQGPTARDDDPPPAKAGVELVIDVLSNDFDSDGEPGELRVISVSGDATTDGTQVFVTPGEESFQLSYTIADALNAQATAQINVLVIPNQAPVITPLEAATEFETPLTLDLALQVVDPDDDDLFFICCDSPRGGSVEVVSAQAGELTVIFTPEPDFAGVAGFSYTADDQKGNRPSGSVSITVGEPGNRAPEVLGDSILLPQRAPIVVDLSRLVTDPDGDALNYTLIESPNPQVGVTIGESQATVTADEAVDAGTTGFFTYQVSDGVLTTNGRIDFEITEGENRPPVVSNTDVEITASSSESVDLRTLTTEPDLRDSVVWTLEPLESGQVSASLSGPLLTVTAESSASGATGDVQFTATDTRGGAATGTISVTVVDTSAPPPSAEPDTPPRGRPEIQVTIDVLANDSDPLLEGLEVVSLSEPSFGFAAIDTEQQVVFLADAGEVGTTTMNYTIRDQAGRESTATITVNIVAEPDQPAPPTVDVGAEQLSISWDTPQLNGSILQGYRITPNIGDALDIAVQNSYVWDGLTNGTEYTFTITALSDLGESLESSPSDPATPNQVPEPPAVRSVTFEDGALFVEWDEPTNLGTPITDYEVELRGVATSILSTGGAESIRWDGLINGETYTFAVRARNEAGWSVFGGASAPEHPAAAPDAPVIGTTVRTQESGALEVNWSVPASNNGDPVIEYLVRTTPNGTPVSIAGENTVTTEWSNLTNGVDVAFQVQARNRAGLSAWSSPSNAVKPCGRPDAPTITGATRGDQQATITWSEESSNGCNVTGYWVSAVGTATEFPTSTLSRQYPNLTNGTSYTFTVQAENEQGRSVLSAPSATVIPAGPPIFCQASGAISATADDVGQIRVDFDAAFANGDLVSDLDYEIRTNGGGWVPQGSNANTYTVSGLQENTTYSFEVRARNTVGLSADTCGPVSAHTWALPTPSVPVLSFDPVTTVFMMEWPASDPTPVPARTSVTLTQLVDTDSGVISDLTGTEAQSWNGATSTTTLGPTQDGTYGAVAVICNPVGCVTGTATPLDIVVPKPPEQVLASEVLIEQPRVYDAQGNLLGVEHGLKVSRQAQTDDREPTEYDYEIERRNGPSASWALIAEGTSDFNAVDTFPWSAIGDFDPLLGYSNHPQGMNSGQQWAWRARVKARNDVGEAAWSDWAQEDIGIQPATIQVEFTKVNLCTLDEQPMQCHYANFNLYGFPALRQYQFHEPVFATGNGEFQAFGGTNTGVGASYWCTNSVPATDVNGRILPEPPYLEEGYLFTALCTSPRGSQIRFSTQDGFFSVWYPGLPQ